MKTRTILAAAAFLGFTLGLRGGDPEWWRDYAAPVIDAKARPAHPQGPANLGQAKWMARQALEALAKVDAMLAAEVKRRLVERQMNPLGGSFDPVVNFQVPLDAGPDWHDQQHMPLLAGQLKALAAPFYQVLHEAAPDWLDHESEDPARRGQLQLNGTKDPQDATNFHPWTSRADDDQPLAIATVGQLKAVFALRFESLDAVLDRDADDDGLPNATEASLGTNPRSVDSDHDGMNDGWEIEWGFSPLDGGDADMDPDGDRVTNLREFQTGGVPTGTYVLEVLPAGERPYYHSAADDGSVVVRSLPEAGADCTFARINAPDAAGTRSVTVLPGDPWNPVSAITAVLLGESSGGLDGGPPEPIAASGDDTIRIYQAGSRQWTLRQPGILVRELPAGTDWQAVNNVGLAAGIQLAPVAGEDGQPGDVQGDLVILYGETPASHPLPSLWLPSTPAPKIAAFAADGHLVICRSATPDGTPTSEYYLSKGPISTHSLIRQPAPGGGDVVALSSSNCRILCAGATPAVILPDGTAVAMGKLRVYTNRLTLAPSALGTLYQQPLVPHHVTPDGRITLTTQDADGRPVVLQLAPAQDADGDGMADDWEKDVAGGLLAGGPPTDGWGGHAAGLEAGDLDPSHDYTGSGITMGDIENIDQSPAKNACGGLLIETVFRRNILDGSLRYATQNGEDDVASGNYYFENSGRYGAIQPITSPAELRPEYMAWKILSNDWSAADPNYSPLSRFYHINYDDLFQFYALAYPTFIVSYDGDLRHAKKRLVSKDRAGYPRSRSFLRVLRRIPYDGGTSDVPYEVVSTESLVMTIPAGAMASDWVELIPPIVDGYEYSFSLEEPKLVVDANRDGLLTFDGKDATSRERPFTFWVNDDHDAMVYLDVIGFSIAQTKGQDDQFDNVRDRDDYAILTVRDLEDFTRLHVSLNRKQLADPKLYVKIEFSDIEGDPSIKIYPAASEDGGMQFLLDNTVGESQLAGDLSALGTANQSTSVPLVDALWDQFNNGYFIFEGHRAGKGLLRLAFYKNDEKIGTSEGVWIELKNIKSMYQRWHVNEAAKSDIDWNLWPLATAVQESDSVEPDLHSLAESDKDYILFLHGWNVPMDYKRGMAETAFKRLWQMGYKGQFGAFFWPTFYGTTAAQVCNPQNFGGSEHRAWESAAPLQKLLAELNTKYPGRVNLTAHSLGNVVAAEALRKSPNIVVNHFVASQAAIAADVFQLQPSITNKWKDIYSEIFGVPDLQIPKVYGIEVPVVKDVSTPNVYAYYFPNLDDHFWKKTPFPTMGSPYMDRVGGAQHWHNFVNPDDWALAFWILNQALKPATCLRPSQNNRSYAYHHFYVVDEWSLVYYDDDGVNKLHFPKDTYETFCYCAQARSNPLGRQKSAGGPFVKDVIWTELGDKHPGHNAEFLNALTLNWKYWHHLLTHCEVPRLNIKLNVDE